MLLDTLRMQRRLREVGFPDEQADVITEEIAALVTGELATKADLRELRTEMRDEFAEVRGEIAEVKGEIAEVTPARALGGIEVEAVLRAPVGRAGGQGTSHGGRRTGGASQERRVGVVGNAEQRDGHAST